MNLGRFNKEKGETTGRFSLFNIILNTFRTLSYSRDIKELKYAAKVWKNELKNI